MPAMTALFANQTSDMWDQSHAATSGPRPQRCHHMEVGHLMQQCNQAVCTFRHVAEWPNVLAA